MLLDDNPKKRPSAMELLSSDLIPKRITSLYGSADIVNLKDTIMTLTDPSV